jgi:hypothetical protein
LTNSPPIAAKARSSVSPMPLSAAVRQRATTRMIHGHSPRGSGSGSTGSHGGKVARESGGCGCFCHVRCPQILRHTPKLGFLYAFFKHRPPHLIPLACQKSHEIKAITTPFG